MRAEATFDVSPSPSQVFAYLLIPRNLVTANHEGPVVEQSEGPTAPGSWYVLAFDQLRVRVEYLTVEPSLHVGGSITYGGLGSRGMRETFDYHLTPIPNSTGTRIELAAETFGGWLPDRVKRLLWPLTLRRVRGRMELRASGGRPGDVAGF